jgi:hypothetical protein
LHRISGLKKKKIILVAGLSGILLLSVGIWNAYPESSPRVYRGLVKKLQQQRERFEPKPCFEVIDHSLLMNDKAIYYIGESFRNGPGGYMKSGKDIVKYVNQGKLVKVEGNEYFLLDTMYYSFPFLTPEARTFIDELGYRFQRKLENTKLQCSRFTLTSILRTTKSINRLKKRNRNAITKSSHLHGTSFDISYKQFYADSSLTEAEKLRLKDVLAETLFEMRGSGKCWVTYEMWQTCFHVVVR